MEELFPYQVGKEVVFVGVLLTSSAGSFSDVTTGISNLMSIVTTMLTTITGNPILCALFVSGFIGIAVGIIRQLKSA